MNDDDANFVPKVHPATRGVEPDDPMDLHGFEVPGDSELMLRMLVEEYARMGWGLEALMSLFRDPFFHSAHGLWLRYGDEELRRRVAAILTRTGVIRVRTVTAPETEQLVQINLTSNT
ncbi:MAG TPA: hypothetical protein VMV69_03350 [Pirellulales bacterium]|nr:hypothetical protein [Pirellulales bacterium]